MGQLQKSAATLGFYGDDLDPEEISALLGVAPTVGVAKGGNWVTSLGAEKVAHTGSWRISADPCEPEDLNGQIQALLAPLTPDLGVWLALTRRFRGVIFCGLWMNTFNDGLQLSADVLGSLAERGLLLDLDLYATDD
jgi:hypothetical protein